MARTAPNAPRSADTHPAGGGESILAAGTRIVGRVRGDGDVRIQGRVEGDVAVGGQMSIDEGGQVTGSVEAASVVVAGELAGDVTSRGPVAIQASARVRGNLGGSEVSLDEGASFQGRIDADFDLPPGLSARGR